MLPKKITLKHMNKITAAITAIGSYVPEYVLSNQVLETLVDTNDEWITSRTGIKERRLLKEAGEGTSYLAIKAAQNLIEKSKLDPKEIDLVIMATTTPDMPVAATGVYVASQIGATNAFAYDLQAACSSFLFGMSTASAYIQSGKYKKVLLIGADKMSSIIDYTDRATCIIFGDGAGAALFEPNYEGLGLQDEILKSDGIGREFLKIEAGGSILPPSEDTIKNKMRAEVNPLTGEKIFNFASGVSLLLFYAFAMQCASTLAITKKETNTWKWPLGQLIFMSGLAYIVALIAFQILK